MTPRRDRERDLPSRLGAVGWGTAANEGEPTPHSIPVEVQFSAASLLESPAPGFRGGNRTSPLSWSTFWIDQRRRRIQDTKKNLEHEIELRLEAIFTKQTELGSTAKLKRGIQKCKTHAFCIKDNGHCGSCEWGDIQILIDRRDIDKIEDKIKALQKHLDDIEHTAENSSSELPTGANNMNLETENNLPPLEGCSSKIDFDKQSATCNYSEKAPTKIISSHMSRSFFSNKRQSLQRPFAIRKGYKVLRYPPKAVRRDHIGFGMKALRQEKPFGKVPINAHKIMSAGAEMSSRVLPVNWNDTIKSLESAIRIRSQVRPPMDIIGIFSKYVKGFGSKNITSLPGQATFSELLTSPAVSSIASVLERDSSNVMKRLQSDHVLDPNEANFLQNWRKNNKISDAACISEMNKIAQMAHQFETLEKTLLSLIVLSIKRARKSYDAILSKASHLHRHLLGVLQDSRKALLMNSEQSLNYFQSSREIGDRDCNWRMLIDEAWRRKYKSYTRRALDLQKETIPQKSFEEKNGIIAKELKSQAERFRRLWLMAEKMSACVKLCRSDWRTLINLYGYLQHLLAPMQNVVEKFEDRLDYLLISVKNDPSSELRQRGSRVKSPLQLTMKRVVGSALGIHDVIKRIRSFLDIHKSMTEKKRSFRHLRKYPDHGELNTTHAGVSKRQKYRFPTKQESQREEETPSRKKNRFSKNIRTTYPTRKSGDIKPHSKMSMRKRSVPLLFASSTKITRKDFQTQDYLIRRDRMKCSTGSEFPAAVRSEQNMEPVKPYQRYVHTQQPETQRRSSKPLIVG